MHWLHAILMGIVLGWGAAIPLGPMNFEMIRRNLNHGSRYGLALGLGACSADVTYLVLFSLGLTAIFQQPVILKTVAGAGILVLLFFAFLAFKSIKEGSRPSLSDLGETTEGKSHKLKQNLPDTTSPLWRHLLAGYTLTLVNAYTLIFWTTVSTQVASFASDNRSAIWGTGMGVALGTVSWVVALNTFLHFTRHKLSPKAIVWFNVVGTVLLLAFALYALYHFFSF